MGYWVWEKEKKAGRKLTDRLEDNKRNNKIMKNSKSKNGHVCSVVFKL